MFNGVLGFLENKLKRSDLWQREELGKYLTKFTCEECGGSRLKKEALSIKIDKCDINFVSQLSIEKALKWFQKLDHKLSSYQKEIASNILKEIIDRLSFLNNVGLNYLQLSFTLALVLYVAVTTVLASVTASLAETDRILAEFRDSVPTN